MRKSPPPFTEEHKKNISISNKGKKITNKVKLKISEALKNVYKVRKHTPESYKRQAEKVRGKKASEKTKEKMRKSSTHYWLGKKRSEEDIKKMSLARKGKILSEETRIKMSNSAKGRIFTEEWKQNLSKAKIGKSTWWTKGEKNHNWKGGITLLSHQIRENFKNRQWRSDIFERDNYICQKCGIKSKEGKSVYLEAHHIKSFSKIMQEYEIKTLKEALSCQELWNINNGITLCEKCHYNIKK